MTTARERFAEDDEHPCRGTYIVDACMTSPTYRPAARGYERQQDTSSKLCTDDLADFAAGETCRGPLRLLPNIEALQIKGSMLGSMAFAARMKARCGALSSRGPNRTPPGAYRVPLNGANS
jgi:hypothetical protein